MPTCGVCQAEIQAKKTDCPRCKANNKLWFAERARPWTQQLFSFFGESVFGIGIILLSLALLIIFCLVVFAWLGIRISRSDFVWTLSQILAIGAVLCAAMAVYTLRFELWYYHWLQKVHKLRPLPLSGIAVLLSGLGALAIVTYITFTVLFPPLEEGGIGDTFFHKIIMPGIYVSIFLLISAGFAFFAVVDFVRRLEDSGVPHPIYSSTNLLTRVVQDDALKRLELKATSPDEIIAVVTKTLESSEIANIEPEIAAVEKDLRERLEEEVTPDKDRFVLVARDAVTQRLKVEPSVSETKLTTSIREEIKVELDSKKGDIVTRFEPVVKDHMKRGYPLLETLATDRLITDMTNILQEAVPRAVKAGSESISKDLAKAAYKAIKKELDVPVAFIVHNVKRTDPGGILMILSRIPGGDSQKADRRYEIEADKWGQIFSLTEKPLPPQG